MKAALLCLPLLAALLLFPTASYAQMGGMDGSGMGGGGMGGMGGGGPPPMDDEPPSGGGADMQSKVPNIMIQRELNVLQTAPEEASDSCISALKELHETQAQLAKEQDRTHDQDISVAQDVLESDYENSIEMCGPDARRLCEKKNPSAALTKACTALHAPRPEDGPS